MDTLAEYRSEPSRHARERLVELLREHALTIGEVTLTSGRTAQYYVDAKRAILLPEAFMALGLLVAEQARACDASAVGGVPVSAIPVACAALAAPEPPPRVFIVRKQRKDHGLQRWIEGPALACRRALPDRRGRGHDRRLDDRGDRARARGGP